MTLRRPSKPLPSSWPIANSTALPIAVLPAIELVAISVDDSAEPVREFRDRLRLTFPILVDPDQTVAAAYQTYRFPESFLIDRGGTVIERYVGPKDWDSGAYVERIRRLLARG